MVADISPGLVLMQARMQALPQASGEFHPAAPGYPMDGMKTVEEIRHARLLQLIDEHGTIQALANALGKSHSQISQLRNQVVHSTTRKPRAIGDGLAREIEEKLGKPRGWMDTMDAAESIEAQGDLWVTPSNSDRWQQTARNMAQAFGPMKVTPNAFLRVVDAVHARNLELGAKDEPPALVQQLLELVTKQDA